MKRIASQSKLRLVTVDTVNNRSATSTYRLPSHWENAIEGWLGWLTMRGVTAATLRLRRGHVRVVARRSNTEHPREMTIGVLVPICSQATWSNDHRKGVRTSLVSFFEWCVGQGITQLNPAAQLPKVKESAPNPRPATDSIWMDLLEHADPRERLMAQLACEAGMRRAEVAVAHRDDLLEDISGWSLIVHGKGNKQRVVPITPHLAKAIKQHCDFGYLFPGQIDGHISAHYVGKLISKLMPPGWSMHKLRHRYATRGHSGTNNLRAVQEALGHVSVATTQKYVAVISKDVRLVSDAAYFDPLKGYTHESD